MNFQTHLQNLSQNSNYGLSTRKIVYVPTPIIKGVPSKKFSFVIPIFLCKKGIENVKDIHFNDVFCNL